MNDPTPYLLEMTEAEARALTSLIFVVGGDHAPAEILAIGDALLGLLGGHAGQLRDDEMIAAAHKAGGDGGAWERKWVGERCGHS